MKLLLMAADEIQRLLSTRRGLLSLGGFSLVWMAVLLYGVIPATRSFSQATDAGLVELILPRLGLSALQQWATPELAIYWLASLYLLPFLVIMTAADQTASDRARGTLRFLVLRCTRLDIFFGRYLGQLCIVLMVVLVTLGSVLVIVIVNSAENLPAIMAGSAVIVVNLMLVLAPYVALMALVSAMAHSARQATLYAIILWILVLIVVRYFKSAFPDATLFDWVLPGSQVSELVRLSDWQTLSYAPIAILQTLVLLSIGAFVMWWRDL